MTDGNIGAAKKKLEEAVRDLVEKRMAVYHDATVYADSLYVSLISDLPGTQGDTRTPAKSIPPLWIEAVQLLQNIDSQTVRWMPVPGSTPDRLRMLAKKPFRPQDTDMVDEMAKTTRGWCDSIMNLIDPKTRKYISASCPSCNQSHVYRNDSGDRVRQPALQWAANTGFECQACKANWSPEQTLFFSRLLGFELPEGVLE